MNIPFKEDERRIFLDDYIRDVQREEELDHMLLEEPERADVEKELTALQIHLSAMREEYRQSLPVLPLSRCPITMQVVYHSFDPYGLDGLWWDNNVPTRPVEVLPSTFFTLNGALKLSGSIEKMPFMVRPGPEVPYVVPEVLSAPGIKAVVSTTYVSGHTAYPIFYFIEDWSVALEPMNVWGANYWSFLDKDGQLRYNEYGGVPIEDDSYQDYSGDADAGDDTEYSVDFDLKKWVEQGKLLWISPGDGAFTLRTGVQGCPYLDLTGRRTFSVIRDGERYDDVELI